MNAWAGLLFFPEEDESALKAEFIRLSAFHKDRFSPFEIAKHVFQKLREPDLRAGQAAEVWANDLDVKEAIRQAILKGDNSPIDNSPEALERRLLRIAEEAPEYRDRIKALEQIAKMKGYMKKEVDVNAGSSTGGNADLLQAIAEKLPK